MEGVCHNRGSYLLPKEENRFKDWEILSVGMSDVYNKWLNQHNFLWAFLRYNNSVLDVT